MQKVKDDHPPQLSYVKMTLAVVLGNGIVLTGLFLIFILYLNTLSPFVD